MYNIYTYNKYDNDNIGILFLFVECISQQEDRGLHVPFLIAPLLLRSFPTARFRQVAVAPEARE